MSVLSTQQVNEAGLADWRLMGHALQARYRTGSWGAGVALLNDVARAADRMDHHPDLDLRYGHLNARLFSHDVWGVTGRDVRLARKITELARQHGAESLPAQVQMVEIGLDTPDFSASQPFWAAVLGMSSPRDISEVRDESGDGPSLWFQPSGHEEPRQRFHLDVTVPPEEARTRIEAALAAGGELVSDEEAPAFVVLADPDGNKVCVCTVEGRDG